MKVKLLENFLKLYVTLRSHELGNVKPGPNLSLGPLPEPLKNELVKYCCK
jgi:hypothetical protein